MKKIIVLLLALLISTCSAEKPAETLSSMQTKPKAETAVTETGTLGFNLVSAALGFCPRQNSARFRIKKRLSRVSFFILWRVLPI